MSNNIGTRIRELRLKRNMSQEHLASLVGYKSRTTINKIESGVNDVPRNKVEAFAKALDTTTDYIMGFENSPVLQMMIKQNQDTPQNRLCEKVRTLEDEECEQVSDYVDFVVSKRE